MKCVKVATRFVCDTPVEACVVDERGEILRRFAVEEYCCVISMNKAILKYLEGNGMKQMLVEVV